VSSGHGVTSCGALATIAADVGNGVDIAAENHILCAAQHITNMKTEAWLHMVVADDVIAQDSANCRLLGQWAWQPRQMCQPLPLPLD